MHWHHTILYGRNQSKDLDSFTYHVIATSLSALTVVGGVSGISLSNTPPFPHVGVVGVFDSETPLTPPTTVRALRLNCNIILHSFISIDLFEPAPTIGPTGYLDFFIIITMLIICKNDVKNYYSYL